VLPPESSAESSALPGYGHVHYAAAMNFASPPSVKQCNADPGLAWLRELLGAPIAATAQALSVDQLNWCIAEGLAPLLANRLPRSNATLQAALRQLAMRELAHQQALQRLAECCQTQGLEVLIIKGEALARTLYTMPCVRSRVDIDLWIGPDQLAELRAVLAKLGFAAITDIWQQWARFEVVHGQAEPPSVAFDVHVHPFFRPRMLQQRPFAAVWADANALPGLVPLRAPSVCDSFLIAALHLAKNSHKRGIWRYDLDRFCALHPEDVTRACLLAPQWGIAQLLADALIQTVAMFDTKLPCTLPKAIGFEPLASMLSRLGKLAALRRDVAVLPNARARWAFLWELFSRPKGR
jgi:Uncharacterised nucleotidyltransferase